MSDGKGGDAFDGEEDGAERVSESSRRDFLKKAGTLGAAGIAATSLGSTLRISSSKSLQFFSDGNEALDVGGEGVLKTNQVGSTVDPISQIHAQDMSGEVYAREYPGSDLKAKIENALDDLPGGRGRVRVTPRADGSAWQWSSTWTVDPTATPGGVEIVVDRNVLIEDSSSGWTISVEPQDLSNQAHRTFTLRGGRWVNKASNPAGWLRGVDAYRVGIHPDEVQGYRNDNGDSVMVQGRNEEQWSENWQISGKFMNGSDICIDMVPASVTGGSGTDSFADWVIGRFHSIQGRSVSGLAGRQAAMSGRV